MARATIRDAPGLFRGVDVNAGKAHSGQDNGWVATTSSTGWGAIKETVSVSPNTDYRMTVWIRDSDNIGS
jgi:hypothetical protein